MIIILRHQTGTLGLFPGTGAFLAIASLMDGGRLDGKFRNLCIKINALKTITP